MSSPPHWRPATFAQLLRRAGTIVRHHRYHRQPVDARDVVDRTLAGGGPGGEPLTPYRGALSEAVVALMHGLR